MIFGPAYKGIPLAVTSAIGLYQEFSINKPFTFNRKEVKDHGEGGILIGYQPQNGDKILITEDVMTSGKSIRESFSILKNTADVVLKYEVISVDRMERGLNDKSAISEIESEFGLKVFPIVNILDIIKYLYNTPVDGKVYINDETKSKIETYLEKYGVK
jgi:orotate phosphoribosyltransferase